MTSSSLADKKTHGKYFGHPQSVSTMGKAEVTEPLASHLVVLDSNYRSFAVAYCHVSDFPQSMQEKPLQFDLNLHESRLIKYLPLGMMLALF